MVLGEGSYGDKLTVTSTGAVLPSAYGADAIYAAVSNAKLTNMGKQYAAHTLTVFDGGTAVESLIFDGKYNQHDFALQATQDGTEVIYAGGAYDHIGGLSDFLPQGIVPPHEEHYGGGALPTAFYLSTGVEDVTLDAATVHFGQFGAAV